MQPQFNTTGHTPLPWQAAGARILTAEGHVLFRPDTAELTDAEYSQVLHTLEADARFVECACNNHEALLAALEKSASLAHRLSASGERISFEDCDALECIGARAAIAAVKGTE
jgi:hypothetical protein